MRQFGVDPNSIMTADGKFQSPDGIIYESSSSESSEDEEKVTVVPEEDNPLPDSQETDENINSTARLKRKVG